MTENNKHHKDNQLAGNSSLEAPTRMLARSYACCYTHGRYGKSSVNIIQSRGGEVQRVDRSSMLDSKLTRVSIVE